MQEYEPIFDGALFERERNSNPRSSAIALWVRRADLHCRICGVGAVDAAGLDATDRRRPFGGQFAAAAPCRQPVRRSDRFRRSAFAGPAAAERPTLTACWSISGPTPGALAGARRAVAGMARRAGSAAAASVVAPPDVPLPPEREVAHIDAAAPLPPARPPEFAAVAPVARGAPRSLERAAPAAPRSTTATYSRSCLASALPLSTSGIVARLRLAGGRRGPRQIRPGRQFRIGLVGLLPGLRCRPATTKRPPSTTSRRARLPARWDAPGSAFRPGRRPRRSPARRPANARRDAAAPV